MSPRNLLLEHYYRNLYKPLLECSLVGEGIEPIEGTQYRGTTDIRRLDLINGLRLRIFEKAKVDLSGTVVRSEYSYCAVTLEGVQVARFDNSPHHLGLPHFPHHKHVGSDELGVVMPNARNTLHDFLEELKRQTSEDRTSSTSSSIP